MPGSVVEHETDLIVLAGQRACRVGRRASILVLLLFLEVDLPVAIEVGPLPVEKQKRVAKPIFQALRLILITRD